LYINPVRNSHNTGTHFISSKNFIEDKETDGIGQKATKLMTKLSARECHVFALITDGHLNKEIAHKLNISVRTVEKHRSHIFEKMETKNITHLVRYAIALGNTSQFLQAIFRNMI
jgi:DNA-binding NarL/FixJ family response regulator